MGRTSKNIKLRIPEKPRKIKGFRTGSYRVATTISSKDISGLYFPQNGTRSLRKNAKYG